ncbi:MAG: thioesterase [Bacteroidales bacterium]|nr:thioesterase [Bacteroidales bacterium]
MIKKRSYPFTIRLQDVDFQHKAPMAVIVDALLSAAIHNADDNGFGLSRLNEMKATWTLIRLAVEMEAFPRQYDEITVDTWVEKVEQIMTTRNFVIRNRVGEVLGKASSHWVMIDVETRRIKDLTSVEGIRQYADDTPVLEEKPAKLPHIEGVLKDSFKVKYSAIDVNGHVNSLRYIEWICNCFSLETHREKTIKRFDINYLHEILFDEPVSVYLDEPQPDDFYFEIRKDDKVACRARVRVAKFG